MKRHDLPAVIAGVVLVSPVAVGALYSVLAAVGLAGPGAGAFTIDAVSRVLVSSETWRGLAWTVAVSAVATGLAMAAACAVAILVRSSRLGQTLALLPLAVPHVAVALAALLLLGQSGLLSRLAYALGVTSSPVDFPALVYDPAGVSLILAFAWKEFPYLTITALAVLLTRSTDLDEVARTLGASPGQVFWRVTWPQLWRGVSPAVLAAFAFLVGQYEMPALLAPSSPTALSLLTYERWTDPDLLRRGEAHVLALLAFLVSAAVVLMHGYLRARMEPDAR